ncbi:MAG: four helix bundle protein [Gammaproteobacteria bacterium]|jgi:four helix bundle protein|nr:four helix bundle protein [Gammaproteobacteria bacterium]
MKKTDEFTGIQLMARYEHLRIYKQAMDVAVHFETIVAGFSRYHKYTLGTDLRNQSRAIVALIIQANGERDKAAKLRELRLALEELLVLIRLAKEVKAFKSFAAYQFVVEQVASVCRQNEGWLRSLAAGEGEDVRGPEVGRRRSRSRRSARAD